MVWGGKPGRGDLLQNSSDTHRTGTTQVNTISGFNPGDKIHFNDNVDFSGIPSVGGTGLSGFGFIASVSNLRSSSFSPNIDRLWLAGYSGVGTTGGGHLYRDSSDSTTSDNGVTVFVDSDGVRWKRDIRGFILVDDAGGSISTAISNIVSAEESHGVDLRDGIYTVDSVLSVTDFPIHLEGVAAGLLPGGTYKGSVVDGSSDSPSQLLNIEGSSAQVQFSSVERVVFRHTGTGYAITFNNVIHSKIEDCIIDCEAGSGANGVRYQNSGYFARMVRSRVVGFSDTGVLIDGTGSDHVIEHCQFNSSQDSAISCIEVRQPNCLIQGGQANVNRSTNDGIGILFNNDRGSDIVGGVVNSWLCERDIAIKLTGSTNSWRNIYLNNIYLNLGLVSKGVIFDRAKDCVLIRPNINDETGGGTLAEFTSNALRCGIIVDSFGSRGPITVDASAARCWMRVEGRLNTNERDAVTTDPNLTVYIDDLEDVGPVMHNGTAWNGHRLSLGDDTSTSVAPPYSKGWAQVIGSGSDQGGQVTFDTTNGGMEDVGSSSSVEVQTGDTVLSGTTGTDGNLVLAASSDGNVYIENRTGAGVGLTLRFHGVG